MEDIDPETFKTIVTEEFNALPDEIIGGCDNVVFFVEDRPEDGSLNLLGLYSGISVTRRSQYGFGELPDRITIYREPLLAITHDEEELRAQIRVTLVHEIAHYYGIDDEKLHALGWG